MVDEDAAVGEVHRARHHGDKGRAVVHGATRRDAPEGPPRDSPLENAARRPNSQPTPTAVACDTRSGRFAAPLDRVLAARTEISIAQQQPLPRSLCQAVARGNWDSV